MLGKPIFEIPVYRCTQEKHGQEMAAEKAKFLRPLTATATASPHIEIPQRAEDIFNRHKWHCWRYNEIIGWICLRSQPRSIWAEYFHTKAKSIRKFPRKAPIEYNSKLFELLITPRDRSITIFNFLKSGLTDLKDEKLPKTRYIDLALFNNIGPHINWRSLV